MKLKRITLSALALLGVGGLVALLRYHPSSGSSQATADPQTTSSETSATVTPAQGSPTPASTVSSTVPFRNGTYTGTTYNVGYGPVQVEAVVSGGRLSAVHLLQMPSDMHHSAEIAAWAGPELVQEAISAQGAGVDVVSGATQDSQGFIDSLTSALSKAKG